MDTATPSTKSTTTDRRMWSEYESNYRKSIQAGSLVVPIVSALVILAFVIAFICVASYIRKRQRRTDERFHSRNVQHTYATDVAAGGDVVWSVENNSGDADFDRVMLDLPPPYPGYLNEDYSPPSYSVACNLSGYDNTLKDDIVSDEYLPDNDYRSYSEDEESPWHQIDSDHDYAESHNINNSPANEDCSSSQISRSFSSNNSISSEESPFSFPAGSNGLPFHSEESINPSNPYRQRPSNAEEESGSLSYSSSMEGINHLNAGPSENWTNC